MTLKTLRMQATPTRNRRLNELLGLMVLVAAGLLLLALVSYTPSDPSWNTVGGWGVGGHPARNWTGLAGRMFRMRACRAWGWRSFWCR